MRSDWRRQCVGVVLAVSMTLAATGLRAQEEKSQPAEQPLIVFSVASFERLLKGADTAFESAGRPELSESIGGVLANVNDLKGLEREQPLGVYVYLSGILPQVVGYVPVDNFDDLLKTVELAPVKTKKTGENTYEVEGRRETLHVKVQDKFAFVSNSRDALDRTFPDPAKATARLAGSYDVAATINTRSMDETTKEIMLTFVRTQTETEMQQRDNEPDSAYRIRRAGAESNLEAFEMLVEQAQEITLGWGVSSGAEKNAGFEVVVVANPGTELAKLCNELGGAKSLFSNLLAEKTPLTFSTAWKLSKKGRKFFEEVVAVSEIEVRKAMGADKDAEGPIIDLFKVLKETASAGQVDMAVQFVGDPPGPFSLVGGVKLSDGDLVSSALGHIVPRLKDNPGLSSVQAEIETYEGVTLHRIEGKRNDPNEVRLYGQKPAVYFGAGGRVLWFAVGGDAALPALKKAIGAVKKPTSDTVNAVPLQFVLNVSSWMDLLDRGNDPEGFGGRARTAFSKGGDALRIDARPIDNGVRFRLQFDEAFIRLFGSEIARRIDRNGQN